MTKRLLSLALCFLMVMSVLPTPFFVEAEGKNQKSETEMTRKTEGHIHRFREITYTVPSYAEIQTGFEQDENPTVRVERKCTADGCNYSETAISIACETAINYGDCFKPNCYSFYNVVFSEDWAQAGLAAVDSESLKAYDSEIRSHTLGEVSFSYDVESSRITAIRHCTERNCSYYEEDSGVGENPGRSLVVVEPSCSTEGSVRGDYDFTPGGFAETAWEAVGKKITLPQDTYGHEFVTTFHSTGNGYLTVRQHCAKCGLDREATGTCSYGMSFGRAFCDSEGNFSGLVDFAQKDKWAEKVYTNQYKSKVILAIDPNEHGTGLKYQWTYDKDNKKLSLKKSCSNCGLTEIAVSTSLTEESYKAPGCGIEGEFRGQASFNEAWANEKFKGTAKLAPAKNHDWTEWSDSSTDTEAGFKTRSCSICKAEEKIAVPSRKPSGLELTLAADYRNPQGDEWIRLLESKLKVIGGDIFYDDNGNLADPIKVGSYKGLDKYAYDNSHISSLDYQKLNALVQEKNPDYNINIEEFSGKIEFTANNSEWTTRSETVYLPISSNALSIKLNISFRDGNGENRFGNKSPQIQLLTHNRHSHRPEDSMNETVIANIEPVAGNLNAYTAQLKLPGMERLDVNDVKIKGLNCKGEYECLSLEKQSDTEYSAILAEMLTIPVTKEYVGCSKGDIIDFQLWITENGVKNGRTVNESEFSDPNIHGSKYDTEGNIINYGLYFEEIHNDRDFFRETVIPCTSDGKPVRNMMLEPEKMENGAYNVKFVKAAIIPVKAFWTESTALPQNFKTEARLLDAEGNPYTEFLTLEPGGAATFSVNQYIGERNFRVPSTDMQGNPVDISQYKLEIRSNNPTVGSVVQGVDGGFMVNLSQNREIKVQNVWQGDSDKKNLRPAELEIQLYRKLDGGQFELFKTAMVDCMDGDIQNTVFDKLPTKNEEEIAYSYELRIKDHEEKYYDVVSTGSVENGLVFTHNIKPLRDITVKKIWKGNGDMPQSVDVQLYQNDRLVQGQVITLNKDNKWTGSFKNLLKYENTSIGEEEIRYSVKEILPEKFKDKFETSYNVTGDTVTIINRKNVFDLTVQKVWKSAGRIPNSIKFELYANGKLMDNSLQKTDAEHGWKVVYKDLPVKDEEGDKIKYTVNEKAVKNYKAVYTPMNADFEMTVTNIYTGRNPDTGDVSNPDIGDGHNLDTGDESNPDTGDVSNPAFCAILALGSLFMISNGTSCVIYRKKKKTK